MLTTNNELFHSNYGNFKSQPTGIDLFEKTFQINHDDATLDFKTVYRNDYPKFKSQYFSDRVTRDTFEKLHQKTFKNKIPMETKTQNMIDFIQYDNKFEKMKAKYNKLFHDDVYSIRKNLSDTYYTLRKPLSDIVEENIETEFRSKSQFNIGSNQQKLQVPDLRVIKKIPSLVFNKKKILPPIPPIPSIPVSHRWESSSLHDLNIMKKSNNTTVNSSYREDYKNPGGFELCRMKVYKVLTNQNKIKQIKNVSQNVKNEQIVS